MEKVLLNLTGHMQFFSYVSPVIFSHSYNSFASHSASLNPVSTKSSARTGAFTVSMATADTVTASDYVGIESATKVPDKFAKSGFHATKSEFVNAPLIDELPMALECKVKSFDNGILVGEIVNINADESVLTDGRIDPAKLKPISYDPVNNDYLVLGEKVGNAFKDGLKLK